MWLSQMSEHERNQRLLRCEVCQHACETISSLYQHLHQAHKLQVHDWLPSRDSLPHSEGCSHCGEIFETRAGLRRHIIDCRCAHFDPDAPNQSLLPTQKWNTVLLRGTISRDDLSPAERLDLTLRCQFCSTGYDRPMDMQAHLMNAHGAEWTASQDLLRFCLQTMQSHTGCLCNPSGNERSSTHICLVYRQLSMIFQQSTHDILVATQFCRAQVARDFPSLLSMEAHPLILRFLCERSFSCLWTDSHVTALLRQTCILCGGVFHPVELISHLLVEHRRESMWAAQIIFQLVPCLLKAQCTDFECRCCGIVFNDHMATAHTASDLALRGRNMQAHFTAGCPVAQQIALLLLPLPAHGESGSVRSGAGLLPEVHRPTSPGGSGLSQIKRRGAPFQENQADQGAAGTKRRRNGGATTAPGGGSAQNPHPTSGAARSGPSNDGQTGLFHHFRPKLPPGGGGHSDHPGTDMASTEIPHSIDLTNIEDVLAPGPHDGDQAAPTTPEPIPEGPGTLGSGSFERHDPSGRVIPVPTLVPGEAGAGSFEQTTSSDGSNDEEPGLAGGTTGELGPCDALPVPSSTDSGHPVDDTNASPSGRCLAPPVRHGTEHGLGIGSNEPQGPQSAAVEAGSAAPNADPTASLRTEGGREGQGQETREGQEMSRDELLASMQSLSMDNSGDMCYANSSFQCVAWSLLQPLDFQCDDWGGHSADFCALLRKGGLDLPRLDDEPWFRTLVSGWEDRTGQADSAEFTSLLLRGMGSPRISNDWHRRFVQNDRVITHDLGDAFQPLTLQIDPSALIHNQVHLNELLRCWNTELGMCGALLTTTDHLCVHLDRLYQPTGGRLQKISAQVFFEDVIQVPVFQSDALQVQWDAYMVTSAFMHLGGIHGGHYQAVLRCFDGGDIHWLHCDDCRPPFPTATLPHGAHGTVTCLWLTRRELLPMPGGSVQAAMDPLLRLLTTPN